MAQKRKDLKVTELESFSEEKIKAIKEQEFPEDWPTVYLLLDESKKRLYVGETTHIRKRLKDHLAGRKRKDWAKKCIIICHPKFNKSVTLDFESKLLRYISGDKKKLTIENDQHSGSSHNFYNKKDYDPIFKEIWNELKSRELEVVEEDYDVINNHGLFIYSPFKELNEEQIEAAKKITETLANKHSKEVRVFVEGGAGTGKTVLLTYLAKHLKTNFDREAMSECTQSERDLIQNSRKLGFWKEGKKIGVVAPARGMREVLKRVFKRNYKADQVDVLGPSDVGKKKKNKYDLLLVDEAHLLTTEKKVTYKKQKETFKEINRKLKLKGEKADQLEWMVRQSRKTVFFFDEGQQINSSDVSLKRFDELRKKSEILKLKQQMRIKGGKNYVNFVEALLNGKKEDAIEALRKVRADKKRSNFEVKNFNKDQISNFKEKLNNKTKKSKYQASRIVSGFSWKYNRKGKSKFRIGRTPFTWDNPNVKDWVYSKNSVKEVGVVNNVQGYDLNYVGVIIGKELSYDSEEKKVFVKDVDVPVVRNLKRNLTDPGDLDDYVKNIYSTLLKRGVNGVYLYAYDPDFREYLEEIFKKSRPNNK